jgi:hypothetical protein
MTDLESKFQNVVTVILWSYLPPVSLATVACTCKSLAGALSTSRCWYQRYKQLWPTCVERESSISPAQWRTLALQRSILDSEASATFRNVAPALLAKHIDDESAFLRELQAGGLTRTALANFTKYFPNTHPFDLRFMRLLFRDGGQGGISGVCDVMLECVIAVFTNQSAAPFYLSYSYSASGYNDDPTVVGNLLVCLSRSGIVKDKILVGRHNHGEGFRSRCVHKHFSHCDTIYHTSNTGAQTRLGKMSAKLMDISVSSGDYVPPDLRRGDGKSVENFRTFLEMLDTFEEPQMMKSSKRRWGDNFEEDKAPFKPVSIPEMLLRFCEAVRSLNDGISSISLDTLCAEMKKASNNVLLEAILNAGNAIELIPKCNVNFCSRMT